MNELPIGMMVPEERVPYEDEEEFEPIRGLPEVPPEGEYILWQGSPTVRSIMHRVMHLGMVTLYFTALFAWAAYAFVGDGLALPQALGAASIIIVPLGFLLFLLAFLAWAIAKTSVYTVTNRRIVLRVGVALSKAVNIPFAQIVGAEERTCRDGTVDIAVHMTDEARPHYLFLWPHVKPRNWRQVKPLLRGIRAGDPVRRILVEALMAYNQQDFPTTELAPQQDYEGDTSPKPAREKAPGMVPGSAAAT